MPLRIAVVHSFYRSTVGGENTAVLAQVAALQRAGHEVRLFAAGPSRDDPTALESLRAGLRVASGHGHSPLAALRSFRPDVVSVHNLFPNYSSKWLGEVDATVVATLHNYRPLCANALLFRQGKVCTRCVEGSSWSAVRFGCYRGPVGSVPLAWANRGGLAGNDLLARADRVIVLSEVQRSVYVAAGLTVDRIEVIPNFVPADLDPGPRPGDENRPRTGWLVVGRLSPEKGVLELLAAWPDGVPITVIGDGPLREAVSRACARPDRRYLGTMSRKDVLGHMGAHRGLAVPSLWFEACPLVYVEALAAGLPVLAWDPCGVAAMVREEATGLALEPGRSPAEAVSTSTPWCDLADGPVRKVFESRYTESRFVERFVAAVS